MANPASDELVAEIRAGLEGVTPGPWDVRTLENFGWNVVHYRNGDKFDIVRVAKCSGEREAMYLARCHPGNIAALLAHLEAEKAAREKAEAERDAMCQALGCTNAPGVGLRFVQELRRDLNRAAERHVELLRTWDDANPTERQELDRLRRGWGPSSPTERQARRTDVRAALTVIERAMDAVLPDDKEDEDLSRDHFQNAYDKLVEGYKQIITILQNIPELAAPDAGEADRDRLAAVVAEAGKVIEPFAAMAALYDPPEGDDEQDAWAYGARPTIGQLRAARAWQEKHGEAG